MIDIYNVSDLKTKINRGNAHVKACVYTYTRHTWMNPLGRYMDDKPNLKDGFLSDAENIFNCPARLNVIRD